MVILSGIASARRLPGPDVMRPWLYVVVARLMLTKGPGQRSESFQLLC